MIIDYDQKTVVITGGAGGIGYSVVKAFLESNAKVAVVDYSKDALDALVKDLGSLGKLKCYSVNLSNVEEIAPAVKNIVDDFGQIDILVNIAAIMGGGDALKMTVEDWDRAMNINSRGLFFMMQQVVDQSMKNNGGSIVNFASMAGIRGMNPPMCSAWYSATKGAVVALTMQAATEWAHFGIRVNAVAPGGVETPAMRKMGIPAGATDPIPLKKLNQPEDIANAVIFLTSHMAQMITGQTLIIDGGASIVGF